MDNPVEDNEISVDVGILGGGSAAERMANLLAEAGVSVAIVERHLVGGECPYYACIPSKAMLRTAALRHALGNAATIGASEDELDPGDGAAAFAIAARRRDDRAADHDDAEHVRSLEEAGVTVVRGDGTVDGPGRIVVDIGEGSRVVRCRDLVIATGSTVIMPDVDGLDAIDPWTFVDAWTATERPASMLVIGAGAVGTEIAQVYARYGCEVTLVQRSRLLGAQVEPEVADDLAEVLREDGVDVRTGTQVSRVASVDGRCRAELSDGSTVVAERVVVATGKRPATEGIGLETVDVDPSDVAIDERCRVQGAPHLWAVGDVTDRGQFTHTANYQARIAAKTILGRDARADLRAVPRTTYTSPEVAAVGMTTAQAEDAGHDIVRHVFDLGDTARGWVDHERAGRLVLVADAADGTLLGASLIAPAAGEQIAELTLAVRARIAVAVLADTIHPFPTWSEGLGHALQALADEMDRD